MIGVPPKIGLLLNQNPALIQSKGPSDSNPKVDHDHFSQSVFPFPCFPTRMPGPLASLYIVSPHPPPHSPTPLLPKVTSLQLKSTTDKNLAKQQLVFNINLSFSWDFMLSSPTVSPPPSYPGMGMSTHQKRQLVTSG